ncbi:MAG: hypothetical protein H6715_06240 [Myxococcales bacterium]|nr:hypothetical protein [Myxococcales bacterium]
MFTVVFVTDARDTCPRSDGIKTSAFRLQQIRNRWRTRWVFTSGFTDLHTAVYQTYFQSSFWRRDGRPPVNWPDIDTPEQVQSVVALTA